MLSRRAFNLLEEMNRLHGRKKCFWMAEVPSYSKATSVRSTGQLWKMLLDKGMINVWYASPDDGKPYYVYESDGFGRPTGRFLNAVHPTRRPDHLVMQITAKGKLFLKSFSQFADTLAA